MRYVEEKEAQDKYDDILDEVYGEFKIGSIVFLASEVLKELDPIAYRCGFVDYCDEENITTTEEEADDKEEGN